MKPTLKAPEIQLSKLEYDEPLSKFAFKFNLRRYSKVTDGHDRVTLMSMLDLFYVPGILQPDYSFSPSGTYTTPEHGDHQATLDFIGKLPFVATPEAGAYTRPLPSSF